jgi:small subunit ribosomal protein S16
MATRIRLRRTGRKKQPEYRIVVAETTAARDGRFVDTIGHYKPRAQPATITVDIERARKWLERGATPTDTVRSLLKQAGVFQTAQAS